jgi:formylmethanofuran dehydrogenase subunit E
MTMKDIKSSEDWKKTVDFHGHVCPGLAIGFKASIAGMAWLKEHRAEDEELVAVVETDACGTDAVQVLTGCTFGKGNFIYKDHGKSAFSFVSRLSGKGVRVALRAGVFQPGERHMELIQKIRSDAATEQERAEFRELHNQKSYEILEKDPSELFTVEVAEIDLPLKAKIEPSKLCEVCGEPTMSSRLQQSEGSLLCKTCLAKKS